MLDLFTVVSLDTGRKLFARILGISKEHVGIVLQEHSVVGRNTQEEEKKRQQKHLM